MINRRHWLSLTLCTSLLLAAGCSNAQAPSVSLEEARMTFESGKAVMVDIRETAEHATGVAKGALLIPMGQLGRRLDELPKADGQPLLIICNTQNRSSRIVSQLHSAGFTNARFVNGGMSQWAARGWPMVKP